MNPFLHSVGRNAYTVNQTVFILYRIIQMSELVANMLPEAKHLGLQSAKRIFCARPIIPARLFQEHYSFVR